MMYVCNPGIFDTPGLLFLSELEAKPSDKGKPGENRGRKVTGLHSLLWI